MADVYWIGSNPTHCEISGEALGDTMYDARTPYGWAIICKTTFRRLHCQVGTGFGQRYKLQPDGRWLKDAG